MTDYANKYHLFIDESGDHGLSNLDSSFPVFVLCGILTSESNYLKIRDKMNLIKNEYWQNKEVIFHSRDIRKCDKEFQILFNQEIKAQFYHQLNEVIKKSRYHIISSAINKEKYIERYGKLSNDVYEVSLSFIIERAIFCLDSITYGNRHLEIIIEKRGKIEDKKLAEHFQRLLARGTSYIESTRLMKTNPKIIFKDKKENINGLQLADLIAYPIARHIIEPKRANPAFDIFEDKFYSDGKIKYGLKIFP